MRSDLSTLLVRHAMYPLHEWLAGRDTLSELDRISAAARLPTSQAQRALSQRVRRTLRRAARTEYYAKLFAALGVDPGSAGPEAELHKLPLLGKSVVRANLERMTRFDTPGGAIASQSGGASGDALRFYTDRRAQAANLAARLFMQSLFGVALGARRAYVWGSPIETRGARRKRWRDRLLNEVVLDAFEMSEPQMAAHLERLAAFRPQVIYGYPSAVARLAQFAEQTGHTAWPCRGNHTAAAQRGGGARESTGPLLVVLTGEEASAAQIEAARRVFRRRRCAGVRIARDRHHRPRVSGGLAARPVAERAGRGGAVRAPA